jgi:hypothetical protein
MSELTAPRPLRVLILGQDPDVLETVSREVAACRLRPPPKPSHSRGWWRRRAPGDHVGQ